ncbi:MAG: hypothetical protein KC561_01205 [Myxococcales bacterium]|nr:hypothetical protein [Myxococcales bacterium]
MRTNERRLAPLVFLLSAIAAFMVVGCSDAIPRLCDGETTIERGGKCEIFIECPEGMEFDDDYVCQLSQAAVQCGPDTELQEGVCVSTREPNTCGENTELVGGQCVIANPVACGAGTSEVERESGPSCEADDELSCASSTVETQGVCTADYCPEESEPVISSDGGVCIGEEFDPSDPLEAICDRYATAVCEAATRCECIDEETTENMTAILEDYDYCRAYYRGAGQCLGMLALVSIGYDTGEFGLDEDKLEEWLDRFEADNDCTIGVVQDARLVSNASTAILTPQYEQGETCLPGTSPSSCVAGFVCRGPYEGETTVDDEDRCYPLSAETESCLGASHCVSGLYCANDQTCQPKPSVGTGTCSFSVPCADGSCCQDGVCVVAGDGDACCDSNRCSDPATFCLVGEVSLCTAYATLNESCADASVRCAPGLQCEDDVCRDRVNACTALNL